MTPVEALVELVVRADAFLRQKRGLPAVRFKPFQRLFIEPFFNVVGALLGYGVGFLPNEKRARAHVWICERMAQHEPEPFPDVAERRRELIAQAQALQRETGQWPAVLFLMSHPDTLGPWAWLRFELIRQGLELAGAVGAARPGVQGRVHPQCFLAIDPYALDSVPVPIGALYAGFMHVQYLAWDRQASTQSLPQRGLLLRGTDHQRVAWRLMRAMRRNPVLMVIAGGLPHNARLFYAAREWAGTLRDAHHQLSRHVIRLRVMDILSTPDNGILPTEHGHIDPRAQQRLRDLLGGLGYDWEEQDRLLRRLADDFQNDVPARARLWRILHARLAKRGVPVLAVPIVHSERTPHVRLGRASPLTAATDPAAFAKEFNTFF